MNTTQRKLVDQAKQSHNRQVFVINRRDRTAARGLVKLGALEHVNTWSEYESRLGRTKRYVCSTYRLVTF